MIVPYEWVTYRFRVEIKLVREGFEVVEKYVIWLDSDSVAEGLAYRFVELFTLDEECGGFQSHDGVRKEH